MTKVVIIGASGFIGKRLYSYFSEKFEVYGTGYLNGELDKIDITAEKELENYILEKNPEVIIWLSAKKDVLFCENHPIESFEINVQGLNNLLNILKKYELKPKIIYISSDRVFDGRRGNYTEADPVSPMTNYGFTKKICETILKQSNQDYKIVRMSAAFGKGGVFTDWVLDKLNSDTKTGIFTNSYFTPTPMSLICENIEEIVNNWNLISEKIIHLSGGERMNRFEFVSLIASILKISNPPIFAESNNALFPEDVSLMPSKIIKFKIPFSEYISQELKR